MCGKMISNEQKLAAAVIAAKTSRGIGEAYSIAAIRMSVSRDEACNSYLRVVYIPKRNRRIEEFRV